jgi:PTH1 family peptidyl-tRNA hydrolase
VAWWTFFRRGRSRKPVPQEPPRWLVAGLGNPGADYSQTRHNFGFMAAEALAISFGGRWSDHDDPPLAVCSGILGEDVPIRVIRPLAFMNRSGIPIRWALRSTGLDLSRLIVLVDDLALPLGSLRIRFGGGDGGHNGLRSVAEVLGCGDFIRIRLGVAPRGGMPTAGEWVDYVLGSFEPDEKEDVMRVTGLAVDAVAEIVSRGPSMAMSRFNRRKTGS